MSLKITEFNNRRLNTWFDFVDSLQKNHTIQCPIDKEIKQTLKKMIDKGTELQRELNEDYTTIISYEYYLKKMNSTIILQDIIIKKIIQYIESLNEWYFEEENRPKKKGLRTRPQAQSLKVKIKKDLKK